MTNWPDFIPEILSGILIIRLWLVSKYTFNTPLPETLKAETIIQKVSALLSLSRSKINFWIYAISYSLLANFLAIIWSAIAIKPAALRMAGFKDLSTPVWEIIAELFTETYEKGQSFFPLLTTNIIADLLGIFLAIQVWRLIQKGPLKLQKRTLFLFTGALVMLPILLLTINHFLATSGISQAIISGRSATTLLWQQIFQQSLMFTAIVPTLSVVFIYFYRQQYPYYSLPVGGQSNHILGGWAFMRAITLLLFLLGLFHQAIGPWIEETIGRLGFSLWLMLS